MNQKNDIAFSSNLNLYLQQNAQADTLGEIVAELRLVIKAYRKMFPELWESDRRDAMLKAFSLSMAL
ncbi:hypothetical protein MKQ70_16145 [Chitinophaga sedimenti]|uniref:hypothetical protein n=1 Tax=Chitinophaga sedimenti TaxID=2033606 RepID=UPI002004EB96|nr:hypothetical protein [Chitinophaga sedimenti]MCK7556462.1 hypothetical protein [Chitinophaga sedimenti]